MTQASGDEQKGGLAPKRVWQGETMTSWQGDGDDLDDIPDGLKENHFKEDVTILKSIDFNKIKSNRLKQ